jgi:hypothetical protein
MSLFEKGVPLYFPFLFWCVSMFVFVSMCPMFVLACPDDVNYIAHPLDLFKLIKWAIVLFIDQVLEFCCDEAFEEVPPSDL